jgi:Protein kinase domain
MEYVSHGSLRPYVGRLSVAQIAGVLEGVLAGLSHGESHGIVHRDLKPENMLVTADGRVKIADFGVARAYNRAATRLALTREGSTIGTPAYMSPEQALGTDLTPATDLYSLGVVTWELLTGMVPFEENDTPVAVLYRHVHEPVPPVSSIVPDIDPGLEAWLSQMLAKRPEERFQTADESWTALEDVILELLGPRWRRQARLVDGSSRTAAQAAPLTPAEFESLDAVANTGTVEEIPTPGAESSAASAAASAPPRSYTTVLGQARRHADDEDETPAPTRSGRRPAMIISVAAAAIAVTATAGVLAAGAGSSPHKRAVATQPTAQQRAAKVSAARAQAAAQARERGDRRLRSIVAGLAVTRKHALAQLSGAHSPSTQVAAATRVGAAYATAAGQIAPLKAQTSSATPIAAALTRLGGDYGRLATAGRARNNRDWNATRTRISADEQTLRRQLRKL